MRQPHFPIILEFSFQSNYRRQIIFYPMFLMVLLTFIVGLITMKSRISSVKSGAVSAKYFKLMESQEVPEIITKTTRNLDTIHPSI